MRARVCVSVHFVVVITLVFRYIRCLLYNLSYVTAVVYRAVVSETSRYFNQDCHLWPITTVVILK